MQEQWTQADSIVEERLRQTEKEVKRVDFFGTLVEMATIALFAFLLGTILDQWIFRYGLSVAGRVAFFALLSLTLLVILIIRVRPLFQFRINPLYAAKVLEDQPEIHKNSVINWLLLRKIEDPSRKKNSPIENAVLNGVASQAAMEIKTLPNEMIVDHGSIIRWGFRFIFVLVLFFAYMILSSKSTLISVSRLALPTAKIAPPQSVRFISIAPGNKEILQGADLEIEAQIAGVGNKKVYLLYSSLDGRITDKAIPVPLKNGNRYSLHYPESEKGITDPFRYRILVGDPVSSENRSEEYTIKVRPAIVFSAEKVVYNYPEYTGLAPFTQENSGDVRALDGSIVQITASANTPLDKALFIPGKNESAAQIMSLDPNHPEKASISFLLSREDSSHELAIPKSDSYEIQCFDKEGNQNSVKTSYSINIIDDLPPTVSLEELPEGIISLPVNQRLNFFVRTADPDFGLSSVVLHLFKRELQERNTPPAERDQTLPAKELLPDQKKNLKEELLLPASFIPAEHGLNIGSEYELQIEVLDNRQPAANRIWSGKKLFTIVDPIQNPNNEEKKLPDNEKSGSDGKKEGDQEKENGSKGKNESESDGSSGGNSDQGKNGPGNKSEEKDQGSGSGDQSSGQPDPSGGKPDQNKSSGENSSQNGQNSDSNQEGSGENSSTGQSGSPQKSPDSGSGTPDPNSGSTNSGNDPSPEKGDPSENKEKGSPDQPSQGSSPGSSPSPSAASSSPNGPSPQSGEGSNEPVDPDANPGDAFEKILDHQNKNQNQGGKGQNPGSGNEEGNGPSDPADQGENSGDPLKKDSPDKKDPSSGSGEGTNPQKTDPSGDPMKMPQNNSDRPSDPNAKRHTADSVDELPSGIKRERGKVDPNTKNFLTGGNDSKADQGKKVAPDAHIAQDPEKRTSGTPSADDNTPGRDQKAKTPEELGKEFDIQKGEPSRDPKEKKSGQNTEIPDLDPSKIPLGGTGTEGAPTANLPPQNQEGDHKGGSEGNSGKGNNNKNPDTSGVGGTGHGDSFQQQDAAPPDDPHLKYTEKATSLALEYIEDQLKNGPDPTLLKTLGWDKKQLRDFLTKWKEMKEKAGKYGKNSKEYVIYEDSLRNIGLREPGSQRSFKAGSELSSGSSTNRENVRFNPPARFKERVRVYQQGISKAGNSKN
ncbi:MAG: hypothetical protein Q4G69_01985 [Planctomycetia bacterium]|nr:hypothetical protein [Planctomycetia bacterium]